MGDDRLPDDQRARAFWVAEVAGDARRTEARYDAWAAHYDADVPNLVGWRAPAEAAAAAGRFLARDARILDAGAGTGLVGEALAALGFTNLEAADLSRGMLEVARSKGIYRALHKVDLAGPLGFPADSFGGLVSVGTGGYFAGEVLAEFARVVRPGGSIVYVMGDARHRQGGFEAVTRRLARAGRLEPLEAGPEFLLFPLTDLPDRSRVRVLRVGPRRP